MANEFDNFKYAIGEIVTTVQHEGYGAGTKALILERMLSESPSGLSHSYLVSHYKLGDMVRSYWREEEIARITE